MKQRCAIAFLWIGAAGLVSGCAALQSPPSRSGPDADLRRLVMETRREVEELRKDQELLRGTVEQLQYSTTNRAPAGAATIAPPPPSEATPPGSAAPPLISLAPGEPAAGTAIDAAAPAAPSVSAPVPASTAQPATPGAVATTTDPMIAAVHDGSRGGTAHGSVPADEVPTVPTELRGSGYDEGVRAFAEQQYEDSIQYFRNFIHGNSTSPNADDAQYWIGEAYLRRGMYSNAIKEFNQVVLRYGSGDRAAPALLKLAQVFSKIGDQVDARLSLQKLVNRYPGTPEASDAHRMLQQMGG